MLKEKLYDTVRNRYSRMNAYAKGHQFMTAEGESLCSLKNIQNKINLFSSVKTIQ